MAAPSIPPTLSPEEQHILELLRWAKTSKVASMIEPFMKAIDFEKTREEAGESSQEEEVEPERAAPGKRGPS